MNAYYILAFAHVVFLVIGFGSVIVIDTFGLLWVFKRVKLSLVNQVADITQRLIWLGWLGLVASGATLLTMKGSVSNLTAIKIFFVAMLGLNGIFLHLVKKGLEKFQGQETIPLLYKFRVGMTSTISQTGWWGAIVIGFMNTRVIPRVPGPDNPWIYMAGIAALFLVVWIVGETILRKKISNG